MSLYDYERSRELSRSGEPFYGLIMAAMRQADSTNQRLLRQALPGTWDELAARYDAPGGRLPGEQS